MNPIDLEVIRCKLNSISDEMGAIIATTSRSPVIKEILDFSCGFCLPDGQTVSQRCGITALTGSFGNIIKFVRRRHGGSIKPGDIFIVNEPTVTGTHTADVAVVSPVFVRQTVIAFAVASAHWSELGGTVFGSLSTQATDIFQEGLRFPGARLYREGHRQDDLFDIIRSNVRLPERTMGDLDAEIAAVRVGVIRLRELCEQHGAQLIRSALDEILEQAARSARRLIVDLTDGVYVAEDVIDGDGVSASDIPIKVAVTIKGDRMCFDFTGTSDQRDSPINCNVGALNGAVRTVFKALCDDDNLSNDGWYRNLEVVVPQGTVFSATASTATGWYFEAAAHAADLVCKALAPSFPKLLPAGSYTSLCVAYLGGVHPESGEPFVLVEPHIGGWGAAHNHDGENALIAVTDGETHDHSVELLEACYPIRVNQYSLNTAGGSGGGEFRGGLGVVREYELLSDRGFVFGYAGRSRHAPWSLAGGRAGTPNTFELVRPDRVERKANLPLTELNRGDRFRVLTGGGGGYGEPKQRCPEAVRADLKERYIDGITARKVYGWRKATHGT